MKDYNRESKIDFHTLPDEGFPSIADLGLIGDQRTVALQTKQGTIVWYCPEKFDAPSLFASLLDPLKGGCWKIYSPDQTFQSRHYKGDSGILETSFRCEKGEFKLTDWMPMVKDKEARGICRQVSQVPCDVLMAIQPKPDYSRASLTIQSINEKQIVINNIHYFYSSHPVWIEDEVIYTLIPQGESGWSFLSDIPLSSLTASTLQNWHKQTKEKWQEIASHITYNGPYEKEVANSIRAIRLLTYAQNGGIIAAATTSLPEVVGGNRNYDYRYVWLRDAGMNVSALTRAGSDGVEERKFLDFICDTAYKIQDFYEKPLFSIAQQIVKSEEMLELSGYYHSKPVRIGNNANEQLQLDSLGNVLLAAKLIYDRFDTREHWELILQITEYLAENWHKPDHGLWEEKEKKQYTSSKVIVAGGLESIARFVEDTTKKDYFLSKAGQIREFVQKECLTKEGAYAAYAGGDAIDISAALFPLWGYTEADSPQMLATIHLLEERYCRKDLFWRHLENFDSRKEGAFLAGTFWIAQYWIMRKNLYRATSIIDAALAYTNDLGFMAEEADPDSGQMTGNFPQTFVHSCFIAAVIDLAAALKSGNQDQDKRE